MGELLIYRRLVAARIRADLQYRTSFFLFVFSQALVAGLDLAVILVLFTQVDSIAGWSVAEVALLYGLAGIGFGLADLFFSEVELASGTSRPERSTCSSSGRSVRSCNCARPSSRRAASGGSYNPWSSS